MKERSKLYSSLGLLLLLNLLIKPVWIFLIDRQVQNQVGVQAYGIYFSLFNFSIVFSFLLDWGLTAFVNRQLATNEGMIYRTSYLIKLKVLFMLLYMTVIFGVALLSGIKDWQLLWKVAGIQILTSLFIFLRAIITSQQWFRTDAWLSILDKTVMILLCAGFIYWPSRFGKINVDTFLWIQLLSTAFAVTCSLIILARKGVRFFEPGHTSRGTSLLKAALPFAMIVLLMSAHYRLDGFLLERLHPNGAYEAGIYAGAYRLLDASNMIGYLCASFLLPFMARHHNLGNSIKEVILHSRHLLLLFSIFISLIGIFMAPWLQQLLYQNNDPAAIGIMQWCLPALIGYSLVQVYGTVLTATGHIVLFCRIVLFSLVVNIILNLLLIPEWGAKGCCMAALISQGICGIVTLIYADKKLGTGIHTRSLLLYIFITAVVAGVLYLCVHSGIDEWWQIAGTALLVFILAIITGLVNIKRWKTLIKQT